MAGENDGGELSSPASQDHHNIQEPSMEGEVIEVKKEGSSSSGIEKNSNDEKGGDIEIEIGSKSKSSSGSSSSSSRITQKVESSEISHIVEPVIEPVDSLVEEVSRDRDEPKSEEKQEEQTVDNSLVEEVSHDCDEPKNEVKQEEKAVVVSENDCLTSSSVVVESVSKENEVVNSPSLDEKASLEPKDCVVSVKDSVSEGNGANRANDDGTIGHLDRKPPVAASTPLAVQKTTSWKGCCGIFELFSGSER
ncbi:hypothetical protein OSB04_001737 [Centaurea solstitialis]|uniref:Uncharacterized protein n=1 Tax=Centaurea solstitialis TaxID=347529 RepID=A0AA38U463_9ASTR|nr:hypothetical protein OSB04_001737 [Centaurea solstitialis]